MKIHGVDLRDNFAEAFSMRATRLIVTASNREWVRHAVDSFSGFATSVIGCGCEAALEQEIGPTHTPDGRPGAALLLFTMSKGDLAEHLVRRVGQCLLTSPGSACYSGLEDGDPLPMGDKLRFFGDGAQRAKTLADRRYWRIPVMDGEFLCENQARSQKAVGGGNFILMARDSKGALAAAGAAVKAIQKVPGVITPFPGGVVRSGSKVGSRYPGLIASTNEAFSPTLRGRFPERSRLPADAACALEIVINGLDAEAVAKGMWAGIQAACRLPGRSLLAIDAGNYGGSLGKYHFHLRRLNPYRPSGK